MSNHNIILLFSGDFAPLIPNNKIADNHFSSLSEIFNTSDLHITNLETPLTKCQVQIEKTGPSIKAEPAAISLLKQAKVNIACLANNHIYDYGEQGIKDTITECEKHNIETIGIVNRPDRKNSWFIKEIKSKKIGFLNYCEHEFSVREKGLMGACGYDPVDAYYEITYLKSLADYLIVIYHGGNEYYSLPRPGLKRDFHYLADLGADLVVGHHTHVLSGYEIYNGKPLVYSLGNFFFSYEGEPESWNEGVILNCMIGESFKFELIPFYQCKDRLKVTLMEGDKKESVLQKIKDLSSIISDDSKLEEAWKIYVQNTGEGLTKKILYPTKVDKLLLKLPFFKKYVSDRSRRRSLINILRCTSIEQLLIDGLKLKQ
ncbi:MAG: CapA family protein [Bacteroidales bacterium]|nr:CapA family protein [Bacteroidales bacterium]